MVRVLALVIVAVALGCAKSEPAKSAAQHPAITVTVMPESWATSSPRTRVDAARASRATLRGMRGLRVIDAAVTARAVRGEGLPGCGDDIACVRRVGQRARSDKALVIKLAELGDTVLVRLDLFDVKRGEQQRTLQRVVRHASAARVAQAIEELTAEAARPFAQPEPERKAWYEQWYTWLGVGAFVVTTTVVGVVAARAQESSKPDLVVTPP